MNGRLLAQKQFDFYSDEFPKSNPYSSEPDANAVDRGRHYLAQFAVTQRVYHAMLAEASKHNPAFKFNAKFPEAATIVPDGPGSGRRFYERRLVLHAGCSAASGEILQRRRVGTGTTRRSNSR